MGAEGIAGLNNEVLAFTRIGNLKMQQLMVH